jgi:hypothetical protein
MAGPSLQHRQKQHIVEAATNTGTLSAGFRVMLTPTTKRAERNTPASINDRIRRQTAASLSETIASGRDAIDARLHALDAEWDTERTLETMAATFMLGGLVLGAKVDRKWLLLSGAVAGFLLQHGLQGWCPPLPVIRALGVRSPDEIAQERYALKAARGDFEGIRAPADMLGPGQLMAAVASE